MGRRRLWCDISTLRYARATFIISVGGKANIVINTIVWMFGLFYLVHLFGLSFQIQVSVEYFINWIFWREEELHRG